MNTKWLRARSAITKAAVNLGMLAVATVIALLLCELIVRVSAPQQLIIHRPDLYRPVDSLGYAHQRSVRLTVNTGDRPVTVRTDTNGFRIGKGVRRPNARRVLLLGDSFMAAMQVEYEQSLAGLIERCLSARTSENVSVFNAGVSGWDPPQYLIQARRALDAAPFDAVVVSVFLGNDVVARNRVFAPRQADRVRTFRVPRTLAWAEIVDAVLAPINDQLKTRSHLFVLLKQRSRGLLMRVGLTAIEIPSELRRTEERSRRWGVTAAILEEIARTATGHGVPAVFVLIPSIEQVVPSVFQDRLQSFGIDSSTLDLDQPERLLSRELSDRGLTYISLLPVLRAAQQRGVPLYGRVDMHPSAEGHLVMWSGIEQFIAGTLGLSLTSADTVAQCESP